MINSKFRKLIESVECKYESAWTILESFRKLSVPKGLPELQPLLSQAMADLSNAYRSIAQERKDLIRRKARLNQRWFNTRQNFLTTQQRVLRDTLAIGRVLGDAYAWFFYQFDQDLLDEHRSHQLIELIPPGIGGRGECGFIERVPAMGESLVLYHGITSLLRIGDVSFFDMKNMRISGLGELKTVYADEKCGTVVLQALMKRDLYTRVESVLDNRPTTDSKSPLIDMPEKQLARLRRQMMTMQDAVEQPELPSRKVVIEQDGTDTIRAFANLLRTACKEGIGYQQFGKGLLYVALKLSRKNLLQRLSLPAKFDFKQQFTGLERHVVGISHPTIPNRVQVATYLYAGKGVTLNVPGSPPIFWWPVEASLVKDLIFGNTIITTIFNSAHFFAFLEGAGFTVESYELKGKRRLRVSYICEGMRFELPELSYYLRLIRDSLFTEEQIVEMLKKLIDNLIKQGVSPGTSVPIRIQLDHLKLDALPAGHPIEDEYANASTF